MTPIVTLRQEAGSHLFNVIQDNKIIDQCDLIAAESIAVNLESEGCRVQWLYPEDIREKRKNA